MKIFMAKKIADIQKKIWKTRERPVFGKDFEYYDDKIISIRSDEYINEVDQNRLIEMLGEELYQSDNDLANVARKIIAKIFENRKTVSIQEVPEGIIVVIINQIIKY